MTKRIFDIIASTIGLVILSPFLLVIVIWIKIDSTGPIFFRQERVGVDGKIFRIHKFRSMYLNSESKGRLTVGNDSRITFSGIFIRKYKIDELAQLIDVLIGNMSLVGPRPEVKEFMDLYPDDIRILILSVRPGITDLASIKMIDESKILSKYDDPRQAYIDVIMPLKAEYYLEYVNNHSVMRDLNIIYKTIYKLLIR